MTYYALDHELLFSPNSSSVIIQVNFGVIFPKNLLFQACLDVCLFWGFFLANFNPASLFLSVTNGLHLVVIVCIYIHEGVS